MKRDYGQELKESGTDVLMRGTKNIFLDIALFVPRIIVYIEKMNWQTSHCHTSNKHNDDCFKEICSIPENAHFEVHRINASDKYLELVGSIQISSNFSKVTLSKYNF